MGIVRFDDFLLDDPKSGWVRAHVTPYPNYKGTQHLQYWHRHHAQGVLPPTWYLDTIETPAGNLFGVVGYVKAYIRPFYEDAYTRSVATPTSSN